jgi:hypothetical protein
VVPISVHRLHRIGDDFDERLSLSVALKPEALAEISAKAIAEDEADEADD